MSYLEISCLDRAKDISIKSVKLFCRCCLSESVCLIDGTKCQHYRSYHMLFHDTPSQVEDGSYICVLCHSMLIKMNKFNLMVNNSECILRQRINCNETPLFIQLEITKQNNEISFNYDTDFEQNIKQEYVEDEGEDEIKSESVDTDKVFLLSHEDEEKYIEEIDSNLREIETSLLDETKTYSVPEHWNGKIEYINLTSEQLEQEKKEMLSQESFTALEFKCHDCVIGFNYAFKYDSHMSMRHVKKEDSILCAICKCYVANRNVKKHMITHYGRWKCCQCNLMVKSKYAIISHYNGAHEKLEGSDFKCEMCSHVARSYKGLQYHKRKHNTSSKLEIFCNKCGKSFLSKETLKAHTESYLCTNQQFECKICHKVFGLKQRLRTHCKQVHEGDGNTYSCDLCMAVFQKIGSWKNHMSWHSNEYECDYCGMKFKRKYSIRDHIFTKHMRIAQFNCSICDKGFNCKKSLRAHIRGVHETTPKNKICDYCGKCFSKSATLKEHLNTHTGERPFSCTYCNANFRHKSALYTHTRLLHLGGKRKRELISVAE